MNRVDFNTLYTYSDNCWRLLGETLAANPDVWEVTFKTTSSWNSIRLLLAHCIGADERIITTRLQKGVVEVPYEDRSAREWLELYQDHKKVRNGTLSYIAELTDLEIKDEKHFIPAVNGRRALTRSDMLFHIINHENYHRGQVVTALQRLDIDPPNFDFVLLKEFVIK